MSRWPMVPLREVMTSRQPDIDVTSDGEYHFAGIYCFGAGAFVGQKKNGLEFAYKRLTRLQTDNFTYPKLMAWEGAFAVVPPECDGLVVSTEFPVFEIDQIRAAPQYISYYFKRASVWPEVAGNSTGTNVRRRRLHPTDLLKHQIPLPPLAEQQRLVEYLNVLSSRLDKARQLRDEADSEHRWLWQGVSRRRLDDLGDVPRFPLGELVEIYGGGTPSKENPLFWGGSIPWVTPKDMKVRGINGAIDRITEDGLANSSARLLPVGAVLIVIRGMILVHTVPVAVLQVPATINQDMKALIPKEGLLPEFLCHALWAMNRDLLQCVDKSSHDTRKFTTPKLLNFPIPVPTIDDQRRLVAEADSLIITRRSADELAAECKKELDAVMPSMLNQVFND